MLKLSIVVPLFNEDEIVCELIRRVNLGAGTVTQDFEIILVDDGSTDTTWSEILKIANVNKKIKAIQFSRNFGHHYAITAGIAHSKGELIVVMDGDLQDNPDAISELYKKINQNYDIVFVNRVNRNESVHYLVAQRIFYFVLRVLSGINFDYRQANFSMITRKVADSFLLLSENSRFYVSTIKWLGFRTGSIDYLHGKRFSGSPSYNLRKRIRLASDIIFAFSNRPLYFAIYLGMIISILSISLFIFLTLRAFYFGFSVIGWASLICSIFFTSGLILIILGVLGLYIGGIFNEVKKRPLYVVTEKINT